MILEPSPQKESDLNVGQSSALKTKQKETSGFWVLGRPMPENPQADGRGSLTCGSNQCAGKSDFRATPCS